VVLAAGSCYALLREMTTTRIETYKPAEVVEPALKIDYAAKEEISTRIRLRVVTDSGERQVVLRTRWVPVRVESFSPIV